ncbi:hypothetical protein PSA7680_03512 [Pseudoruegeria aquimaris]|uniref:Uncharacterized protein n=1 Tax=Pseudoruegeria aquimaris TaxID=393663 RepID=A0A1Y5TKA7_9RHOB|nr:hypothetical protein [Pseudoruegeria aquimaris]SLN66310.1 hypothetical protein PSA7680_03512 [Pseudoruegeria aquimaris]
MGEFETGSARQRRIRKALSVLVAASLLLLSISAIAASPTLATAGGAEAPQAAGRSGQSLIRSRP